MQWLCLFFGSSLSGPRAEGLAENRGEGAAFSAGGVLHKEAMCSVERPVSEQRRYQSLCESRNWLGVSPVSDLNWRLKAL